MKRFAVIVAMVLSVLAVTVTPAIAATPLRVSAKASADRTSIHVSVKASKRSRVTVAVYSGTHKVASIKTSRSVTKYSPALGVQAAGAYSYRVTAVSGKSSRSVRGKVTVPAPVAPAPAPAPVAPAPVALSPQTARWFGTYVPAVPTEMAPLVGFETEIGAHAAVVNFFVSDAESFPAARVQNVVDHGSIPMITLEFWSTGVGGLSTITGGSRDAKIAQFADGAKASGQVVWLRPFHEMNGNWYPWGGTMAGNSPQQLVAAWQHVKDIFTARGATNVKFVWCVNNDSVPNTSANQIANYWPGDAYVDYVALDGYNSGTAASWSTWRSFGGTFGASYGTVTRLTAKPLFIAETASVEQGGDKAAWITDMFKSIVTTYPRVTGVCWFNANKERDWRVDSSTASLDALKTALAIGF
ncbi:MAG TPA: glycosyl hydrolase [Coriobacteriia bacterium]